MRLKEKQFVPFIVIGAILSVIVIIFSSFHFNRKQEERFRKNLEKSELLVTTKMRRIATGDSLNINQFKGQPVLLVFWASWSDKSESLLSEVQKFVHVKDSLTVLAALVHDAEESLPEAKEYPNFYYLDGTHLYNELKVPGIPSYVLFGKKSEVLYSNIGYQKGVGYDSLKIHLP